MLMWLGLICGPLAVALGVLPLTDDANLIMRPLLAISILAALVHLRPRFAGQEIVWAALLTFYFVAVSLSAFAGIIPGVAWVNIGRQAFILVVAIAFVFLLREPDARMVTLKAMMILLLSVGGVTAWVYIKLIPGYGFNYDALRIIKGVALTDHGVALNTVSYFAVIALLGVYMAYPLGRSRSIALFAIGFLGVFLLGSRAPIIALGIAWLVVHLLRGVWRTSPLLGLLVVPIVAAAGIVGWMVLGDYAVEIRELFGPEVLREVSIGRTDLWQAGLEMFAERPLFGWGPDSWKSVLLEFLPGADDRIFRLLSELESGNFHNGLVLVAAERGSIGLIAALAMQLYLFWCAVQVYTRRVLFEPQEQRAVELIPLIVLFMFMRGLAESSGLFGSANSEVDYLTYLMASYVVAMHVYGARLEHAALGEALSFDTEPAVGDGLSPAESS